ncbi:MAG: CHAT domain-containing protein [Planctomycetota bacterium]|jgi:CHAT domain-containing protein/Tfp pilus assembly protein PilF
MRQLSFALALILLAPGRIVVAEDPLSPARAADRVLAAVEADDEETLEQLAAQRLPGAWAVADELCRRGAFDAAEALARATPGPNGERLPAYVEALREREPAPVREALEALRAAFRAGDFERVLEIGAGAEDFRDSVSRLVLHFGHGAALAAQGRLEEAIVSYDAAAELAKRLGWLAGEIEPRNKAGDLEHEIREYEDALASYDRVLELATAIEHHQERADAYNNRGVVLKAMFRSAEALDSYRQSLAVRLEIGDRPAIAITANNVANAFATQEDPITALWFFDRMLALASLDASEPIPETLRRELTEVEPGFESAPDPETVFERTLARREALLAFFRTAKAFRNIGMVLESLGHASEALTLYEIGAEESRILGDPAEEAAALHQIGGVHEAQGALALAFATYERAVSIWQRLPHPGDLARTYINMARIASTLGDAREAMRLGERALEVARASRDRAGEAGAHNALGNLHDRAGDAEAALGDYARALEIQRALGVDQKVAETLCNVGLAQQDAGDDEAALASFEESLSLYERVGSQEGIATVLLNLGNFHRARGELDAARNALQRARKSFASGRNAEVDGALASAFAGLHLAAGDYREAVKEAREAVRIVNRMLEHLGEVDAIRAKELLGMVVEQGIEAAMHGDDPKALAYFLESGRAGMLLAALESRDRLREVLISEGLRDEEAGARWEERRARESLHEAEASGELGRLRSARRDWEAAQGRLERVIGRIRREAGRATGLVYPEPDDLRAIQRRVGPDEALVLYGWTDEVLALVLTRSKAAILHLASWHDVHEAFHDYLEGEEPDLSDEKIAWMRKLLIEPLALGPRVKRLLISPSGPLGFVPFALLAPGLEVAYVPSGTVYGVLQGERRLQGAGVLALGDPDYRTLDRARVAALRDARGRTDLEPLPHTAEEAKVIGDTVLLDQAATEAGLRRAIREQERWRAVHLACHGLVDPEHPLLCSLAITADADDDGFFTAAEIFETRIPADLVVLSACETGRGRVYLTEGIVGLTRAFMFAGAPRVLCSLWRVDDEATRALMIKFYELWNPGGGDGGMGVAAALRAAQDHVRSQERWAHPRYWAAWVLWGLPE